MGWSGWCTKWVTTPTSPGRELTTVAALADTTTAARPFGSGSKSSPSRLLLATSSGQSARLPFCFSGLRTFLPAFLCFLPTALSQQSGSMSAHATQSVTNVSSPLSVSATSPTRVLSPTAHPSDSHNNLDQCQHTQRNQ